MIAFDLQLLDQYWFHGSRVPSGDPFDVTSHGKIRLLIDGEDIAGCEDPDSDYGINQSAVRLLQTIFIDNIPDAGRDNPVFYHGCSIVCTCPNCIIDFRVRHDSDGSVELDHFYVTGGPSGANAARFEDKYIRIANLDYARPVVRFAKRALKFLPENKIGADHEISAYKFLKEQHAHLIDLAEDYLQTGRISEGMKQYAIGVQVF